MRSPNRKPRDPARREEIRARRKKRQEAWLNNRWWVKRDRVLLELGYTSYEDYLRSDRWQVIRRFVLERARGLCEACGDRATVVHHKSYDAGAMRGLSIEALMALCAPCHDAAHEHGKWDLKKANRWLRRHARARA